MADSFLGQISLMSFNFAPKGWSQCDGQTVPINQNPALFSLLGTTYGGNGTTTFALPDLRGRVPLHQGTGAGLSPRILGENGGAENHTLNATQLPVHSHTHLVSSSTPNAAVAVSNTFGNGALKLYATQNSAGALELGSAGGNQPHSNVQPFTVLNFCIAMQGIYPIRQ